ncbi:hypothetical protein [Streptomyces sp. TLI_185]|nr:hypothetical protein [Streptomyces sp. TLI_185]
MYVDACETDTLVGVPARLDHADDWSLAFAGHLARQNLATE